MEVYVHIVCVCLLPFFFYNKTIFAESKAVSKKCFGRAVRQKYQVQEVA